MEEKVIDKDFSYFSEQIKKQGFDKIQSDLEELTSKLDLNTTYGRELLQNKEEVLTKLIYHNRSREE